MRLSDWSSDVCSSDLAGRRACARGEVAACHGLHGMGRSRRLRWRQGRNLRHGALSMNRARSTLSALAIVATIAGASVAAVASTVALIDVRSTPPAPSPDVLSIRLQDEDTADRK